MSKCENKVHVTTTSSGKQIFVKCGETYMTETRLCPFHYRAAELTYPQGWRFYPGDTCKHGSYVGGIGADLICWACEMGYDEPGPISPLEAIYKLPCPVHVAYFPMEAQLPNEFGDYMNNEDAVSVHETGACLRCAAKRLEEAKATLERQLDQLQRAMVEANIQQPAEYTTGHRVKAIEYVKACFTFLSGEDTEGIEPDPGHYEIVDVNEATYLLNIALSALQYQRDVEGQRLDIDNAAH